MTSANDTGGGDRPTREPGRVTRAALMEAALAHIADRGVLAGLNMREVANDVGVTPANIYHHFGSRQELLRAALTHQIEKLTEPIDSAVTAPYAEWRTAIFDLIQDNPPLRSTALLALDGDPSYEPLPLWELAVEHYERLIAEGDLPEGFDYFAAHVLTLSMSMGVAIYSDAVAHQAGIDREEVIERARTMFVKVVEGLSSSRHDEPDAPAS